MPSNQKSFNYQTIDGGHIQINAKTNKFIIKGFKDKLVFLKIFGWDCEFCKKERPEFIKLKTLPVATNIPYTILHTQSEHRSTILELLGAKKQKKMDIPKCTKTSYF